MIGEFLTRLAIALPLISALAVLILLAAMRGWIRLPMPRPPFLRAAPLRHRAVDGLQILSVQAVAPTARVAVLRFHGREHLLAVNGPSLLLIATEEMAVDAHQSVGGEA